MRIYCAFEVTKKLFCRASFLDKLANLRGQHKGEFTAVDVVKLSKEVKLTVGEQVK